MLAYILFLLPAGQRDFSHAAGLLMPSCSSACNTQCASKRAGSVVLAYIIICLLLINKTSAIYCIFARSCLLSSSEQHPCFLSCRGCSAYQLSRCLESIACPDGLPCRGTHEIDKLLSERGIVGPAGDGCQHLNRGIELSGN